MRKSKKQIDIVKLLKKELPKYGFSVSEKSMWDNYNAKTGKWKGKGIGDVLSYTRVIKELETYKNSGEYKIEIEQAMRYGKTPKIEFIKEILSVGICVKKH